MSAALSVWCLLDGKPGHQNQVLGIADALARQQSHCVQTDVAVPGLWASLRSDVSKIAPDAPAPDFIIGAGHRSHLPMILLAKRLKAKSVVLMKPTLPLSWFGFALIPTVHNLQDIPANVLEIMGVVNRIRPAEQKKARCGLCLIGGPSNHYHWDSQRVLEQMQRVAKDDSADWQVVTSRRTPLDFLKQLKAHCPQLSVIEPDDVPSDWLAATLPICEQAWVTQDSVSMLYEAHTSGARVGVLELDRVKNNRVTQCADDLIDSGRVLPWSKWDPVSKLPEPSGLLSEADRCATWLLEQIGLSKAIPNNDRRVA